MAARLKVKYTEEIAPALMKKFGYKSVMQIPKLDKIIINVGCGEARENPKAIDAIVGEAERALIAQEAESQSFSSGRTRTPPSYCRAVHGSVGRCPSASR